MAKKKIKIPIKEKLHYKKPLKSCNKAIDDITRIRNNEQSKLRYRIKKFDAIPGGKKGKGRKKEADALRKEIKAYERGINDLKGNIKRIRTACDTLDNNKGKITSLKHKASHVNRKLKKWPKGDLKNPKYKELQNEFLKHWREIKGLQLKNTDVLYRVNKGLGFEPEVIAERFDIDKDYLKKNYKDDFDEEFFEELEEVPAEGAPGGGPPPTEEPEEEEEIDEEAYNAVMDEIFWQVSQNFTKIESYRLGQYTSVIIEFNDKTSRFAGTSISLIEMKFNEAVRWAETQPPYVMVAKYMNLAQTKLKYVFYQV